MLAGVQITILEAAGDNWSGKGHLHRQHSHGVHLSDFEVGSAPLLPASSPLK
jgi:hypothetical protein